MHEPRTYQREAIDAVTDYWQNGGEHPLVVLATGTGKSLVQALLTKEMIHDYSGFRVGCVTHSKELIGQNFLELVGEWPFAPAGIYSAGLGRRDSQSQILFMGIQSVFKKAKQIGWVDLLIIDEAQAMPRDAATRYGIFILALLEINPDMRVLGLTATPYRTDSGSLVEGEERLFTDIVYTYGIAEGIADGYLASLSSKATDVTYDLKGIGTVGGDYNQKKLNAAVDKEELTRGAVDEIMAYAKAENRKSWLVFCAGVDHAEHARDEIRSRGISCEAIVDGTSTGDRDRWIEEFKAGKLQCLTNNSILTVGFNAPGVDLLACLRPTKSAGLYVQLMGRGTRPLYHKDTDHSTVEGRLWGIANGPKPNCRVLDFAGNVKQHGPVDLVRPKQPGEGKGEMPVKECPGCRELIQISIMVCPCCGHEFEAVEKPKHETKAADLAVLSKDMPKALPPPWLKVQSRKFTHHVNKEGAESVCVEFMADYNSYRQWLSIAKSKHRSDKFWRDHAGQEPYPADVEEFLDREHELRDTAEIQVRPDPNNKRYKIIVGIKSEPQHRPPPTAIEIEKKRLGNMSSLMRRENFDMDIPF